MATKHMQISFRGDGMGRAVSSRVTGPMAPAQVDLSRVHPVSQVI